MIQQYLQAKEYKNLHPDPEQLAMMLRVIYK